MPMFQALIDQAQELIQRLYACAEKGRNDVPLAVTIRYSEYEAWDTSARGIIGVAFGADTAEMLRWRALAERRAALLGEARRNDVKRGEFLGLIDYFQLAIGMLREFDAAYQHDMSMTSMASQAAVEVQTVNGAQQFGAPISQHHAQEPHLAAPAADPWQITLTLNEEIYNWLADSAAAREQKRTAGHADVVRLATAIIERVAAQTQRVAR